MSNKIILKKSSVAGKIPTVNDLEYGELALNYTDGKLWYKDNTNTVKNLVEIGSSFLSIDRKTYTASLGDTTFAVKYTPPAVIVAINGVVLSTTDYTATNGVNIVLASPAAAGDEIDLIGYSNVVYPNLTPDTLGQVLTSDGSGSLLLKDNPMMATTEPIGHKNKEDSSISFNASTRTFTISPVSSSFEVWCAGRKFVYTSSQSVTIPNTTGLYYIYFDSEGVLQYKTTFFTWESDAPTAYIYWNATTGTAPFIADERHGVTLDWQTHEYLHRTRGAVIANGFTASNYTLGGDGSSNTHAQIDISNGTFFDEDLEVQITHSETPVQNTWQQHLQGPARIPVFYMMGNAEWRMDSPTDYPFKSNTLIQYNYQTNGVWALGDVESRKYAVSWVLATNNINYPIICILGQSPSDNINAAEALNFSDLVLTGFPVIEFRPLYKLIFRTDLAYTNTPKASLISIWDLRQIENVSLAASTYSPTNHGTLSGLGNDDHAQYVHIDNARTITANHTFTGNLTFSGSVNLPDSGVTAGSYGSSTSIPVLTVNSDGLITSASTASITTALTIAGDNSGTDSVSLATDTLTIAGGVGLTSTRGNNVITLDLDNTAVTAGTYGTSSAVPVITVDAQGRITNATTTAVAGVSSLQYDSSSGVITIGTSAGTNFTVDIGVGSSDSPTFASSITLNNSRIQSDTVTTNSTTANQVLVSLSGSLYRSAEFIIQGIDSTDNKYHTTKILAIHNGTTANSTEYGMINVGGVVASFTADYSGGSLRLLCTPVSASSTVFKITSIISKV